MISNVLNKEELRIKEPKVEDAKNIKLKEFDQQVCEIKCNQLTQIK